MREKILLKMLTVTDRATIKLKIEYGREKSLVQYILLDFYYLKVAPRLVSNN